MNIQSFINQNGLSMDYSKVSHNPNMISQTNSDREWNRTASHWKCIIYNNVGHTFTVFFSQGSGIKRAPTLEDVLDCVASDSSSVMGNSFSSWCSDFGYTGTSAEKKTYDICIDQASKLRMLLGNEAFNTLLYDVDRL